MAGPPVKLSVVALCSCIVVFAGCSHGMQSSTAATASSAAPVRGDAGAGRALFAANCAACHGATGVEGGVGPSLKNERLRNNDAQAIAVIEDPQPPMPKLYPAPLTQTDVANLAAYVESL
jgi:mono/diheme cytochrome c family protein